MISDYRSLFVGLDVQTPLLDGPCRCYTNLDNAASTPPLKAVQKSVDDFIVYYSSVHRGTGFKSQLSTHTYELARRIVMDFVRADRGKHTCIFGKNTTEAVNKLARRFPFSNTRDVVLTSSMEHHSNDLPWRSVAHTVHVKLTPDGQLDEADFDAQLTRYGSRVAMVAITAASNVTGTINPVHDLAEKVHKAGAMIMVDCAQLAPHRRVDMRPLDDPAHFDFITISAHKMYAPFGTGALIGRKDVFALGEPDLTGGGTVEIVTLNNVVWTNTPDQDEAGSLNVVVAIALAAAIRQLDAVIPLMLENTPHFLVAAVLGFQFGIGVRSGCFCAHPYTQHLLGLDSIKSQEVSNALMAGDKSNMPGMIRTSFGLYNTIEEVDYLVDALTKIAKGEDSGKYLQDRTTGEYQPIGYTPKFDEYFKL